MYIHIYQLLYMYIYYSLPLQEYTASAWRVDICEPLIILLHIQSISKYLDGLGEQHDVEYTCTYVTCRYIVHLHV